MIPITNVESAVTAKYQIELVLLQRAQWQLDAGDGTSATTDETGYELRIAWGKLIFSWWDDSHARSWRLTAYDTSNGQVRLEGIRGVAQTVTGITLTETGLSNDETQYEEQVRQTLLASGYLIKGVRKAGGLFKLILEKKHRTELFVAVNDTQPQAQMDRALGAGIRWLSAFNRLRPVDRGAHRIPPSDSIDQVPHDSPADGTAFNRTSRSQDRLS